MFEVSTSSPEAGVTAVHVVFDNPGLLLETPNTGDNRITSDESPLLMNMFSFPLSSKHDNVEMIIYRS